MSRRRYDYPAQQENDYHRYDDFSNNFDGTRPRADTNDYDYFGGSNYSRSRSQNERNIGFDYSNTEDNHGHSYGVNHYAEERNNVGKSNGPRTDGYQDYNGYFDESRASEKRYHAKSSPYTPINKYVRDDDIRSRSYDYEKIWRSDSSASWARGEYGRSDPYRYGSQRGRNDVRADPNHSLHTYQEPYKNMSYRVDNESARSRAVHPHYVGHSYDVKLNGYDDDDASTNSGHSNFSYHRIKSLDKISGFDNDAFLLAPDYEDGGLSDKSVSGNDPDEMPPDYGSDSTDDKKAGIKHGAVVSTKLVSSKKKQGENDMDAEGDAVVPVHRSNSKAYRAEEFEKKKGFKITGSDSSQISHESDYVSVISTMSSASEEDKFPLPTRHRTMSVVTEDPGTIRWGRRRRANIIPELAARIGPNGTVRWRPGSQPLDWLNADSQHSRENIARKFVKIYKAQMKSRETEKPKGFKKWKFERAKEWEKNKKQINDFFNKFEIWRKSLKKIEGQFGAAVSSYFGLVRWLMFLNLFITIIILSVIVFPHQFLKPSTFYDTIVSTPNDSVTQDHINAHNCSVSYMNNLTNKIDDNSYLDHVLDFFQGTGWMEKEVMFMGWYFNKTLHFQEDEHTYNVPLAYLLTTAAYFLVILIVMVRYTAGGARSRLVYRGDKFYMWCSKVFCGWDYLLCQEKAAAKKHDGLYKEYLVDLAEQKREMNKKTMSTKQKVGLFTVRVIVNLIVLAMLGGAICLIYFVVAEWTPALLQEPEVQNSSILTLLVEFLPSITITVLNSILPLIFEKLVLLESYSPDGEVKITIVRTVFLRLASVIVLLITIRGLISCDNPVCGNCKPVECWETFVGQQFYRLIILDFLVVVIFTFLVEFPRKWIVKKFKSSKFIQFIGYQEFNIPKNVLDIVYSQTISWFGGFFSPLVPAITVMKFFTFFYVKKVSLLNNCIPCARSYGASRTMYFFMFILLLSFVLITPFLLFAIGMMQPSHSCGPFRVYTRESEQYFMYTVVSDSIDQLPDVLQTIIRFLWSWMVYVPLMVIVCLLIFYYYTVSAGNKRMIVLLKDQLALEGKDKQFLLARVNEALMRGDFATE